MAPSDLKGEVSASTQNSPGAAAESPVERQTVQETGRVSDRVHTHQTTAAHAAQDRSRRDPPGTALSRDPRTGTTRSAPSALASAGVSGRHKEPGSRPASTCCAQPPSKAGGDSSGTGGGTTATEKPSGAQRATGPDEARRTNAGPRGTPERHAAGQNQGMRTGAKPQRPPGAANPGSAQNTRRTAAQEKVPRTARPPRPHPPQPQPVGRGPGRTPKRTRGRGRESARPRTPHTQARGAPTRATSWRPHSAQSQLARARAVGLVTGPHARTHSQWVVGPGRTPERTSGRGWESARPRTPGTQARSAPLRHPHATPTARKASSQERALWGCRRVPTPAPPAPPASG